jgi:hypothetical protein
VTEAEPHLTKAELCLTDVEPRVTEAEPRLTEAEPHLTDVEPGVTEAEPSVTEVEPRLTEAEPHLTEAEPGVTEVEPGVTQARRSGVGSHPGMAARHQDAEFNDSTMCRGNPRGRPQCDQCRASWATTGFAHYDCDAWHCDHCGCRCPTMSSMRCNGAIVRIGPALALTPALPRHPSPAAAGEGRA